MPSLRSVEVQGDPTPSRASLICASRQLNLIWSLADTQEDQASPLAPIVHTPQQDSL
uniref:Uncharacterized protein n=1 Tax=Anguilla anguilla TaxID=7936 RepID=A0A0E9XUT0_ANGAN